MGLFGGDNDSQQAQTNALIDEQINQSQAELAEKKRSLMEQRIAIVHSQGAEQWSPDKSGAPRYRNPKNAAINPKIDFNKFIGK